jgi:YfiH family protein
MIRPPGWSGVAFSEGTDGDVRNDRAARSALSGHLGVTDDWAELTQVHGDTVLRVTMPGIAGDADALWTTERGLPVAIFTADCFGVVLASDDAVGVAHAGWRGVTAGVVHRLREAMSGGGHPPARAAVGPGIGPCCFEVGPEVAELFDGVCASTWGTTSVDLQAAVGVQLEGLELWASQACTFHEEGWFSHRADGTPQRMASIGWLS